MNEPACIGCTNCASIASATFMMESDHGRARAFQQQGDAEEVVEEAIESCPVDCIFYVPWEELRSLEMRRRGQVINNVGRLVSQAEGGGSRSGGGSLGGRAIFAGGEVRSTTPAPIAGVQAAGPGLMAEKRAEMGRKRAKRAREWSYQQGQERERTRADL